MSGELGVSRIEVNEQLLDQVAAGQQGLAERPSAGPEGRVEITLEAREKARELVLAYFGGRDQDGE